MISLVVFFLVKIFVPEGIGQTARFTQMFALIALVYLYMALLAGPLSFVTADRPRPAYGVVGEPPRGRELSSPFRRT